MAHPLVGDVRGIGLILGMELMRDGEKRIPFDPALDVGARVDAGVQAPRSDLRVVGDRLVFAPPLVIEDNEIEEIGERLGVRWTTWPTVCGERRRPGLS